MRFLAGSLDCFWLFAVYVGNLAPNATDEELRELFQIYGVVLEVKMYRKGSYAFVNFQTHDEAVKAIVSLNGQVSPHSSDAASHFSDQKEEVLWSLSYGCRCILALQGLLETLTS